MTRLTQSAVSPSLEELVATERSLGRWTVDELHDAATRLGFGEGGVIGVDADYLKHFWDAAPPPFAEDADQDDSFIESAYKHQRTRPAAGSLGLDIGEGARTGSAHDLKTSLKILAEFRGSRRLMSLVHAPEPMSPARAFETLGIPGDLEDDAMICTIYNIRVRSTSLPDQTMRLTDRSQLEENPANVDKINEAFGIIAETRNSERLKRFVQTGADRACPPSPPRAALELIALLQRATSRRSGRHTGREASTSWGTRAT